MAGDPRGHAWYVDDAKGVLVAGHDPAEHGDTFFGSHVEKDAQLLDAHVFPVVGWDHGQLDQNVGPLLRGSWSPMISHTSSQLRPTHVWPFQVD